jgi:hypothetical protein
LNGTGSLAPVDIVDAAAVTVVVDVERLDDHAFSAALLYFFFKWN